MKKHFILPLIATLGFSFSARAQGPATAPTAKTKTACASCIRAHEEFLASDAMLGRGSGTADELKAAYYVADELRKYGIAPSGDDHTYIQSVPLVKGKLNSRPRIDITPADGTPAILWTYGEQFFVNHLVRAEFTGPLQKIDADHADPVKLQVAPGAIVLVTGDSEKTRRFVRAVVSAGATAGMAKTTKNSGDFNASAKELPTLPNQLQETSGMGGSPNFLELSADAVERLKQVPEGSQIHFQADAEMQKGSTWNVVGILQGSDPELKHGAILLSAHLDHLGVGKVVNGDSIYNGADDDASGVAAVLELARLLGAGPRPRRTVMFALFGSEESGGLGSTYFREHPPVPLKEIAANLEFEMIGRADPRVQSDTVWLTGWERSDLGPTLAAHGANLVRDPHPEQNFFARSDNYVLAKKGVVAQTVSSYGLHKDYHQPSDDVAHLDFKHMVAAIGSLLAPVEWLVNSDFTPHWNKGGKP